MHSLIIHMTASSARYKNVERLLTDLPNAEVIEAVDGRLPDAQVNTKTYAGTLHKPNYPFPLSGGEIGCFLSHRKCWQRIIDAKWPAALIVEDDFQIDPQNLSKLMKLVERNATADSFIRIPPKDREPLTQLKDQENDLKLYTPHVIGLQTTAQVVGRNAAKRLLEATDSIDRPVDTFLQMHWITGVEIETILPNGSSEKQFAAGSTVQRKSSGTLSKLKREIARARYRSAINRRPQI